MAVLDRLKDKPDGKMINVTAITPTPLGEGKTVTAVGLSESMNARRHGRHARAYVSLPRPGLRHQGRRGGRR